MVNVYSFRVWDQKGGVHFIPVRKSTAERIAILGGEIIPSTEEEVDEQTVHEGRYDPEKMPPA